VKHRQPSKGRHRAAALGRHRADEPLFRNGRHRAPLELAERGRQVAATAALVATVGAAGAAFGPDEDPPPAADTVALEARAVEVKADRSAREPVATPTDRATPAAAPAQRKATPAAATPAAAPKTVKVAAKWVDPMPGARVTSCFGPRWGRLHAGVDLAIATGTPIRAVGAGTVVSAGPDYGGYGISVLVDHGNGFLTHYAHLSKRLVGKGDTVAPGEVLGKEGSTGHVTGPHLHFEVHKGRFLNQVEPMDWLRNRGVDMDGC
jgi:murein DD-endopeptidase MepM/ murein hydrolase activator NlpD